jgi:glycosyltransferase involved in cell wall biosynthesis
LKDGENGLLFNPNEPSELITVMCKLFRQPELRQRLARQALEDAERRFHIRLIASQWEDFYHQVISQTRRS